MERKRLLAGRTLEDPPPAAENIALMLLFADVATGPVVAGFGILGLLLSGGVVLLEAGILALLRWGPFLRCLWQALVINLVSMLPGLAAAATFYDASQKLLNLEPPALGLAAFAMAWLVTLAIEAPLLRLLAKEPWTKCWRIGAILNVASYAMLLLCIPFLERYL